ncbi:hypothetical protein GPECTOR_69g456 [Gonium pectorale]|uniref:Mre11 DNA-binding domain-containing protein n=1 Tax=Gonium pectorale TaxID=33097 RepID=A0A150G3G9_GONPE|nr:hypothetical protein GPECTOR_69g456 [Gonium pectorale]|eukprot:KXZ44363.1 hypothetical protein GPECTOR_69g456 [Gonium pectorale]
MAGPDGDDPHLLRILISTDNHLGVWEKDETRRDDSFRAFEEVLQLAVERRVDFVLLGGDLFHENKPSRATLVKAIGLFTKYCLNDRPVRFRVLSDQAANFVAGQVNFESPNLNVGLPVLTIHGNHDDPAGQDSLSAVDILSQAGLVNYFGKHPLTGSGAHHHPGESRPKHAVLLEMRGSQFRTIKLPLRAVRPFEFETVALREARPELLPEDGEGVARFLTAKIQDMISRAAAGYVPPAGEPANGGGGPLLPLIRLRVDYTGYSTVNSQRLGQRFVGKVANPHDMLQWTKAAARKWNALQQCIETALEETRQAALASTAAAAAAAAGADGGTPLTAAALKADEDVAGAVRAGVERRRQQKQLKATEAAQGDLEGVDLSALTAGISPGGTGVYDMDEQMTDARAAGAGGAGPSQATTAGAHEERPTESSEEEDVVEDSDDDSDEDMDEEEEEEAPKPKATRGRAAGRGAAPAPATTGRGRGRGAAAAAALAAPSPAPGGRSQPRGAAAAAAAAAGRGAAEDVITLTSDDEDDLPGPSMMPSAARAHAAAGAAFAGGGGTLGTVTQTAAGAGGGVTQAGAAGGGGGGRKRPASFFTSGAGAGATQGGRGAGAGAGRGWGQVR